MQRSFTSRLSTMNGRKDHRQLPDAWTRAFRLYRQQTVISSLKATLLQDTHNFDVLPAGSNTNRQHRI
jgi:hypothetical protein